MPGQPILVRLLRRLARRERVRGHDSEAGLCPIELHFVDQMQWRYELIRPLVLLAEGTPTQRAVETHTHPDTVRTFTRRFRAQGMLGLLPNDIEVRPRGRAQRVPEACATRWIAEALYAGFHYRELARILFYTFGYPIHHNVVVGAESRGRRPAARPVGLSCRILTGIRRACRSSNSTIKAGTR